MSTMAEEAAAALGLSAVDGDTLLAVIFDLPDTRQSGEHAWLHAFQ
jgi:hypothetical protein